MIVHFKLVPRNREPLRQPGAAEPMRPERIHDNCTYQPQYIYDKEADGEIKTYTSPETSFEKPGQRLLSKHLVRGRLAQGRLARILDCSCLLCHRATLLSRH